MEGGSVWDGFTAAGRQERAHPASWLHPRVRFHRIDVAVYTLFREVAEGISRRGTGLKT